MEYIYRSTNRLFKDVFLKYLQNDVSDEQEIGFLLHPQHNIFSYTCTSTSVTELYYN